MLFADGKSTGDSCFSGARGCSHLTERSDETFSVMQFLSADREMCIRDRIRADSTMEIVNNYNVVMREGDKLIFSKAI